MVTRATVEQGSTSSATGAVRVVPPPDDTTTIRVDRATAEQLKRLAARRGSTVTETAARAVRLLTEDGSATRATRPLHGDGATWPGVLPTPSHA